MKILHTIDTAPNRLGMLMSSNIYDWDVSSWCTGVVALSPSSENCYIAYPANATTGEVMLFDAINLQAVNILQAHKSPVTHLAFNYDGTMLATCSDKVTPFLSSWHGFDLDREQWWEYLVYRMHEGCISFEEDRQPPRFFRLRLICNQIWCVLPATRIPFTFLNWLGQQGTFPFFNGLIWKV